MTTYTHATNQNTYTPIRTVIILTSFGTAYEEVTGVEFSVLETGMNVELTNYQISKLLVRN